MKRKRFYWLLPGNEEIVLGSSCTVGYNNGTEKYLEGFFKRNRKIRERRSDGFYKLSGLVVEV